MFSSDKTRLISKGYSILVYIDYGLFVGMKYKYSVVGFGHPATIHLSLNKIPLFLNNLIDDNNKICFVSKFDVYKFIKNKFEHDIWYKQNLNKNRT